MNPHGNLFEIVGAAHTVCGFANLLNGGNQKANQYSDDGNNYEKFDQGETLAHTLDHRLCPS
jgi:hypothetical protein